MKTAIITGCAGGIGFATVKKLTGSGIKVLGTDILPKESVSEKFMDFGGCFKYLSGNLACKTDREKILKEALAFLGAQPERTAIFEAVEAAVAELGESAMEVKRSQISWKAPRLFAALSLPLRVGRHWPEGALVLTFGLGRRLEHPRIFQAAEPYPGRWTHHVVVQTAEEIDRELLDWIHEAYLFSMAK